MTKPCTGRRDPNKRQYDERVFTPHIPQSWDEYEAEMWQAEQMAHRIMGPVLESLRGNTIPLGPGH